ncbi:MAG: hypothetical protein FWF81_02575 [Defluviitaleaceae bacterium]|nr:hypothetical protein [Defluviitaleaceae bacterium]
MFFMSNSIYTFPFVILAGCIILLLYWRKKNTGELSSHLSAPRTKSKGCIMIVDSPDFKLRLGKKVYVFTESPSHPSIKSSPTIDAGIGLGIAEMQRGSQFKISLLGNYVRVDSSSIHNSETSKTAISKGTYAVGDYFPVNQVHSGSRFLTQNTPYVKVLQLYVPDDEPLQDWM